jgi:hypothetical protein
LRPERPLGPLSSKPLCGNLLGMPAVLPSYFLEGIATVPMHGAGVKVIEPTGQCLWILKRPGTDAGTPPRGVDVQVTVRNLAPARLVAGNICLPSLFYLYFRKCDIDQCTDQFLSKNPCSSRLTWFSSRSDPFKPASHAPCQIWRVFPTRYRSTMLKGPVRDTTWE